MAEVQGRDERKRKCHLPAPARPPGTGNTLLLHFYWLGSGEYEGCSLIILACGIHTLRVQIDSSIKVFRVSYLFRL